MRILPFHGCTLEGVSAGRRGRGGRPWGGTFGRAPQSRGRSAAISPPHDVTYFGSTGQPSKPGTTLTVSSLLLLQIFTISFLISV